MAGTSTRRAGTSSLQTQSADTWASQEQGTQDVSIFCFGAP